MKPTPETDAETMRDEWDHVDSDFGPFGPSDSVPADLARKLERERDEWKAKYIQQNKDLGCEMMDPNGTIWDHAKTLQRERDEARAEMAAIKAMLLDPVEVELDMIRGNIAIPARPEFGGVYEAAWAVVREELTQAYAKLDRILKLTIHDDTFWAIEEIARISGGESDCSVCGGCFMIPGSEKNDDVMNTPCPKCNAPESISNQ